MFNKRANNILKDINALHLIPVTKHSYIINEQNNVVLQIPKFKNKKFARWFIPGRKSIYYSVKLDEIGSRVYMLIDGKRNIGEICEHINKESEVPVENLESRASLFISNMYKYRFINFEQLLISKDTIQSERI